MKRQSYHLKRFDTLYYSYHENSAFKKPLKMKRGIGKNGHMDTPNHLQS